MNEKQNKNKINIETDHDAQECYETDQEAELLHPISDQPSRTSARIAKLPSVNYKESEIDDTPKAKKNEISYHEVTVSINDSDTPTAIVTQVCLLACLEGNMPTSVVYLSIIPQV